MALLRKQDLYIKKPLKRPTHVENSKIYIKVLL